MLITDFHPKERRYCGVGSEIVAAAGQQVVKIMEALPYIKQIQILFSYLIFNLENKIIVPLYIFSIRTSMKKNLLLITLLTVALAQSCAKGGLVCGQGSCHYPKYIEGCFRYSIDNTCASCEYNYQLKSGICLYTPNLQGLDCCSQFNNNSVCIGCSNGLLLNPNTNLCEDKKIQGCLLKTSKGCNVCSSQFDLVGSICVKSVQGCTAYDQYFNCISCNNSYLISQGSCIPIIQLSSIPNCKYINEFGCAECNPGFRVSADGSCSLPSLLGCLVVGNNGNCLQCQSPYYQLVSGQCNIVGCLQLNSGACSQCNSALGFVLTNKRCQIPNCIYFDLNGCKICKNGLIAGSWGCKNESEKVCLICKIDEYMGKDNKCYKRDIHCIKYQNGLCLGCCDSFYLDTANTCSPKQFGCVYANGVCNSCLNPFSLVNGSCLIYGCTRYSAQGCITCDSRLQLSNFVCGLPNCKQLSGFTCSLCQDGFQLTSTKECVPIDINCQVRSSLNVCLKCKQNYFFDNNGICKPMKVGCNYVDGICTSCRSPFNYEPKSQTCIIDGCLSYFVGGCSQCDSSYKLLFNSCKLPNCLISKSGKCLQCDPDYVFTSLGLCVSRDQFCDKMNQYGVCVKCMSNYYYNHDQQKCIKRLSGCIYDDKGICCSCVAPFTFSNGQCLIYGCDVASDDGCVECAYPFTLTANKICEIANCNAYKNGTCVGCKQGFALNKRNLCVDQDPYCLNYNIEQTKCLSCIKGYRFDEKGRCGYADQHCWEFDPSGICMNCDRIYFLNPYGKCQLRDPQCKIYTNGFCTKCAPYYFAYKGECFANLKGCKNQQSYNNCLVCDNGYSLDKGVCKAKIVQLDWNSIDMNFNDDSTQEAADLSRSTFTSKFTSTSNLVAALATNSSQVFFSSSSINDASFQVDSQGSSGWSPVGQPKGAFIGLQTLSLQTFYAVDIKILAGSSLSKFSLQFSTNGKEFTKINDFSLEQVIVGSVKTFYFTPVYAKYIRIVVVEGTPNIKFQFYFSSDKELSKGQNLANNTYIGKTVIDSINGAEGGISSCGAQSALCWAGVESCEPRKLSGFSLIYTGCGQNDQVQLVKIDYSMDGISFTCWNNCKQVALTNNGFTFPEPLLAQKVHIHFSKYRGNPRFGIKFAWAQA